MNSRVTLFVGLASALGLAACAYGTSSPDGTGGASKGDPQASGDVTPDAAPYDNPTVDDAGSEPATDGGTPASDAGTNDSAAAKADTGVTPPPPVAQQFGAGELLVTEILYNPSGSEPDEEWFEVTNRASAARSLNGLVLTDGSGNSYTIPATPALDVPVNGYVVLARNKTVAVSLGVPSAKIIHEYSLLTLANGTTGALTIKKGTTTLATVPFGQWSAALNGESIQLKTMTAPATASSWCFSSTPWSAVSDYGTPGQAADCP